MTETTYDMTGSPECAAWLQAQGIDPTRATKRQCVDALNANLASISSGVDRFDIREDDVIVAVPVADKTAMGRLEIVGKFFL